MREDLTEVVFILDRSGSMGGLESDTIGGFNSFIESQKGLDGEAVLTTVLFDHEYEILHDGVNLKEIKPITEKEYSVRGMTALLDAVGKTINVVGERLRDMKEEERPSKVIFVITTDGMENSSKEFTYSKVGEMIQHQTKVYKWQFIFLGANIDSFEVSNLIGINPNFASNYTQSSAGVSSVYSGANNVVTSFRNSGKVDEDWRNDIK